ncbi:MASE3 domain-containing protein [Candidatus Magnetomonas plexicatena]|uniref:MASE3 domain-containing protein n=1 Tax=Candidatus Magnetomonas plexicatena TaxID=2552947 RepID=UPI001C7488B8|nr:PAS domain S-box protein [Nitrospirales bacterium LBB_01]
MLNRSLYYFKTLLFWVLLFCGLYICNLYSYIVFHSLTELFTIVIAFSIFIFTWHSRHLLKDHFFLLIGISYFFVGFVDIFHTLAHEGINIFPAHGENLSAQLWLCARYVQILSFFGAVFFMNREFNRKYLFILYSTVVSLCLLSIFKWQIFPDCYIEGVGVTTFRVISEFAVTLLLITAVFMLMKSRNSFTLYVYRLLYISFLITIFPELSFTTNTFIYNIFHVSAHFFKIAASFLILKVIIEMGLVRPYNLMLEDMLESRDELKKLSAAVEQSADMIVITNFKGTIEYVNPAFETITGFSKSEIIGCNPSILKSGKYDREFYEAMWNTILSGRVFQHAFINKKKDGTVFYEDKTITPITNEQNIIISFISIGRDVTERKRAEQELIERSNELLHSNQELEQYAYVASHDLLEPLRMTTNYAQLLSKKYADSMDDTSKKYIDYILGGVQRMRSLITDLLSFSRVTSQGKQFKSVSMNKVLKIVLSNLEPLIDERKVNIYSETLPDISGDRTQMIQLLLNLIGNAIKFGNMIDPEVRIWAKPHHCSVKDSNKEEVFTLPRRTAWLFCISDNGIGIDNQYLERIFYMFERLHARNVYEGTGIGLSICKKIVERHGGNIWAESVEGEGSSFYFTLFS